MNEQNRTDQTLGSGQGAQGSVALADELFAKHGGEAQGQNPLGNGAPAMAAGASAVDSSIIAASITGALRALDSALCRRLGFAALRATGDKGFAGNIVAETQLTDEETKQIGNLSGILAQKYSLAASFAPEIALGFIVIGYGARFNLALNKIGALTKVAPTTQEGAQP